jgi:hypothetical protein
MAHALPVHADGRRRHCYKCGGNHVAMWCRASQRPANIPTTLWSVCTVTPEDSTATPPWQQPPPPINDEVMVADDAPLAPPLQPAASTAAEGPTS